MFSSYMASPRLAKPFSGRSCADRTLCPFPHADALPDRHGSLRKRASLGSRTRGAGARGLPYARGLRQTLCQTREIRVVDAEAICEAHATSDDAFRCCQERLEAIDSDAAPDARSPRRQRTMLINSVRGQMAELGWSSPKARRRSRISPNLCARHRHPVLRDAAKACGTPSGADRQFAAANSRARAVDDRLPPDEQNQPTAGDNSWRRRHC